MAHSLHQEEKWARAEALLRDAPFAYLAVVDHGSPFVIPMNFAWVRGDSGFGVIYLHTGPGRKSRALASYPRICLAVTGDTGFDQGPTPCTDGYAFRSAVAEGTAALLKDREERETGLRAIIRKYDPDAAEAPLDQESFARTLVYCVTIESLSYKEAPRR